METLTPSGKPLNEKISMVIQMKTNRLKIALVIPALLMVASSQIAHGQDSNSEEAAKQINAANSLVRDGDFDEAINQYGQVKPTAADRDELEYNLAVAQFRKGDIDAAEERFNVAASSSDANIAANSRYNLGNCLYSKALESAPQDKAVAIEQLREAISYYRDSLRLNEDNADARANIELAGELIRKLQKEQKQEEQQQQQNQDQQNQEQKKDQQDKSGEGQGDQQQQNDEQNESGDSQSKDQPSKDQQSKGDQSGQSQQDNSDSSEQSSDQQKAEENQSSNQDQSQSQSQTQSQGDENQSEQNADNSESHDGKSKSDSQDQKSREQQSQGSEGQQTQQKSDQQSQAQSQKSENGKLQNQSQQDADQASAEEETGDQTEQNAQAVPTGDLTAGQQDESEEPTGSVAIADPHTEEGVMSKEEALKMLQAVRDRDMLRRLRQEQTQRSRHVPVDRDW